VTKAREPDEIVPGWALEQATRPDARAQVDSRLGGVLAKIRDAKLVERIRELYGYLADPRVPARYKVIILAGLLYLVSPIDAIPDVIPGIGFADDAAVLIAILVAVQRVIAEGAQRVVTHAVTEAESATKRVVTHAVAEAEEAFARRGVQQIALSLWAVTLASCVGIVYLAARAVRLPGAPAGPDPFVAACLVIGAAGLVTNAAVAHRTWRSYRSMPARLRDPLARAILATIGARQVLLLATPIVCLVVLAGLKLGLAAR
jgi:uncharacterized membrane protein YkvA (DUF1232 family)